MSSPETTPTPDKRPKSTRGCLVVGVVAVAVASGMIGLGIQERGEQQRQVHEMSEQRLASFRAVFDDISGKPLTPLQEEVRGCGDDNEDCRIQVKGRYSTNDIQSLAAAIESGFEQHDLNPAKGAFGTHSSLGAAAGEPKFTVEYLKDGNKTEDIVGASFYVSAYVSCEATHSQQEAQNPFTLLQAGTCHAAISMAEISGNDTSGGFH